jgi:hypothetical protein
MRGYRAFMRRGMLVLGVAGLGAWSLTLTACDPMDGWLSEGVDFTGGSQTACGSFIAAKESDDGRWILEIRDETAFTGDSVYEQELADSGSARVTALRHDQTHILHQKYCNDVYFAAAVWETRKATQGRIRIKVYDVVVDTPENSGDSAPVSRSFRMNIELHDVKLEGGEIKNLYIDSLQAGWLPG